MSGPTKVLSQDAPSPRTRGAEVARIYGASPPTGPVGLSAPRAPSGFDIRAGGMTLFGRDYSWGEVGGFVMQGALLSLLYQNVRRAKASEALDPEEQDDSE